ncbi:unnamed protein product (macronuclear) [Paramecium tetraurelia]|uniref:Uncharacterized protein n=1 Tax=Paramecium tetraurelia TaxID=5888 RepID=A0C3I4_PARTE|nr:uncharacterized protein GSPATT00034830001 [Paramecium tetraurelia]CAK65351.1 unnamed protein product [Paramecium tetraurelia]|eukprot:XP_001432748.1 hypothetical protein (macronuclear) [Paramecium tetraurelia strain d4-2]
MGCCQNLRLQETETIAIPQLSIKQEFTPKTLQMEPFSLNLIKGDIDCIERLGSTCVDNILGEKQLSRVDRQQSEQIKGEVIIDLRQAQSPSLLIKDRSSRNLNNKFIGML